MTIDRDFKSVSEAFSASRAGRSLRLLERVSTAADDSAMLSRARAAARSFEDQPAARRIAAIAQTVAVAAVAHGLIRQLLPAYSTSGLPWWWNAVVAMIAVAVSLNAAAMVESWPTSLPARVWRRLID